MPTIITKEELVNFTFEYYLILLFEHIGDIIASEPVIGHLKKLNDGKKIIWAMNRLYYETLIAHPDLDYIIVVDDIQDIIDLISLIKYKRNIINLHFDNKISVKNDKAILHNPINTKFNKLNYFYYGCLLETFSQIAGLPKLSDQPTFHILPSVSPPSYLPKKYFAVHCKSNDYKKNWCKSSWTKLSSHIIEAGWNVVEFGFEPIAQPFHEFSHGYFDLTHIRHIQVIASILQQSSFFIGIDSGFAHIANALKIDGLVLLGRYAQFIRYNPYSGLYSDKKYIIHATYPRVAKSITFERVWNKILSRNII
jgi:ADP-heptose:LPS heptosyltransferase